MNQSQALYSIPLNISQVEKLTGVPKSTLRFWEKSFSEYLNVGRSEGKQRQYLSEDVDRILNVKKLLKDEMFTLQGARRRLGLEGEDGEETQIVGTPKAQAGKAYSDAAKEQRDSSPAAKFG
ncbi:MAG: MerR family transcriptional regulator [Planctomycetes bacterium]|nr:MerR family transcriptional regulator [Planctomycetota bacterium]